MLNSLRSDRRIPKSPTHPVLLGEPERGVKIKDERLRTKEKSIIYRHSGIPQTGIHSFYYFWIPAFAGITDEKIGCL